MNKSDLIREVHERMDKKVSMKELDLIVDAMLEIMSDKLKTGEEVQLAEFGTFSLTKFAVKPAEVHTRKQKV
jgi:nucleoid DNA-binding protein